MSIALIKAPNAVDIEVGRRIRQRRAMLGFTQGALAEHLGITFQQVQKYEKGTNRIGSSRLQDVARFLDVSISYFFDDLESPRSVPLDDAVVTVESFLSSGEGLALNRAFLNIRSEKVRRTFVAMVKSLANDQNNDEGYDELSANCV